MTRLFFDSQKHESKSKIPCLFTAVSRCFHLSLLCAICLLLQLSSRPVHAAMAAASTTTSAAAQARIAIIGGGAAGLACARVFTRNQDGTECVVLEKDPSIGGVWNHGLGVASDGDSQSKSTSANNNKDRPMYQGLRTNLPKEIMAFREYPWPAIPSHDPDGPASFVTHRQVQQYLQDYRQHFDLQVMRGQEVQHLKVLKDTISRCSPKIKGNADESWPQVELTWMDNSQETPVETKQTFDAVLVANGHYSLPSMPPLPGLEEHFQGQRIMHSVSYNTPQEFAGQTVLCIGGRASGADIAREIAVTGAKQVYISDAARTTGEVKTLQDESNHAADDAPPSITWVPATVAVGPGGHFQFDHDCPLQPNDIDVVMFCTGYDYSFPFINTESSGLDLETTQRRVTPLYQQLFHAHYPNIAFIGLPHSVLPFPFFEFQAEACRNVWLQGSTSSNFPQLAERLEIAAHDAVAGGEGKAPDAEPRIKNTHYLGAAQWDYCRRMAQLAGLYDESIEAYLKINKEIYDHAGGQRKGFPGGPDHYRKLRYERDHTAQTWRVLGTQFAKQ
mmetsp:Transcript_34250/g.71290  ORF Transcript_34250/g.71290 Transcript_34250/m.71290 type:complete len:560 (-) Transcript_34250:334-2013(-)